MIQFCSTILSTLSCDLEIWWMLSFATHLHAIGKQEMSQSRDECPQSNWSSIRQI